MGRKQWNPKPPGMAIPPDVEKFVVAVGRLTALEHALADIIEDIDGCDFTIDSYGKLKSVLQSCRQIAREALGKGEDDGDRQES